MALKTGMRIIIIIISLLIIASCASKNFSTTIIPVEGTRDSTAVRFRIASITPLPSDEFFITGYTDSDYWSQRVKDSGRIDELAGDLQEKACSVYPDIFSSGCTALPLNISVVSRSYKNTSAVSSFFAAVSWGLFGMVLPLPLGFSCDYVVSVACPEADISQETTFGNRLSSWISFPSPLALIPVPGRADRRACVMYPYQSRYYTGKHFMLECFVEAIVQALYKADREKLFKAYAERCWSTAGVKGHAVSLWERR